MSGIRCTACLFALAASLFAAPKLRLVNTAIGPVSVGVGANGPTQAAEAFNAGDGALSLTLSSNSTWVKLSTAAPGPCSSQAGSCIPLQIGLQTAALAKGIYTAIVTVNDPHAVDAPQTFTVTVQIGAVIPDQIDLFVTPNGTADKFVFNTNSPLSWTTSTENQQNWLFLSLDSAGSFRFVIPYRIEGRALNMGEGSYRGSVKITGSNFAGDNKTTNVTLHVTSQPIALVSPAAIHLRAVQNVAQVSAGISLSNRGLGALSISNVTIVNATPGFSPAATQTGPSTATVSVNPSGLAPGLYSATVSIGANAANGTVTVPLELEVVPIGPPLASFQGVVNNANFEPGDSIGQGGISAVFGEQLSSGGPQTGSQLPLVNKLSGVRVLVNGNAAPLFYTSANQVDFQMPYDTPPGDVFIQVERDGQVGNTVSAQVTPIAPRLLRLGIGDYGVVVNQDGTFPVPTALGIGGHPAHVGDTLVIYAIGFGVTNPAVPTGAPAPAAEPLARVQTPITVLFGNRLFNAAQPATPTFVGLTPNFVGLYQINVVIPPNVAAFDEVPVNVTFGNGGLVGSQIRIAVQ